MLFFSFALLAGTASRFAYPDASASILVQHLRLTPFWPMSHVLWGSMIRLLAEVSIGPLVLRLNLFSATCGALATWFLYQLMLRVRCDARSELTAVITRIIGAITGAAMLITAVPVWMAGNRAHYASFDMALLLGLMYLLARYRETRHVGRLFLFAVLCSLGMAESATLILWSPLLGITMLYLMWRCGHLRPRVFLILVLCALAGPSLLLASAWQFARAPVAEWRDFATYGEVLRFFLRELWLDISVHTLQRGWLLVFFISVLPCLASLMTLRSSISADEWIGTFLLHVVLVALGVVVLANGPVSPWVLFGASPLFVTPYILVAYYFGYALSRIYILIADRLEQAKKSRRGLTVAFAVVVGGLTVVTIARNYAAVQTRGAAEIHRVVSPTIQHLSGRSLLVTEGLLEMNLLIEARAAGAPLSLVNTQMGGLSAYRRYAASLADTPRARSLAHAGLELMVLNWLQSDTNAVKRLAVHMSPDIFLASGFQVVPWKSLFLGVPSQADIPVDMLLAEHEQYWDEVRPALDRLSAGRSDMRLLGGQLRAHLARVANDLGIVLENAGRKDDAIRAYRGALSLAPSNISAALNLSVLLEEMGEQAEASDLLARVRDVVDRPDFQLSLRGMLKRDGHLRRERAFVHLRGAAPQSEAPPLDPRVNEAVMKYLRGDKAEARAMAEGIVAAHPELDTAWILLASVSFDQADTQSVQRVVAHMQAQRKEWPDVLVILGRMALQQGDTQRARDYFERVMKRWPANQPLLELLIGIDLAEKNFRRVEDRLATLLMLDPGNVIGNFALGTVLYDRGEYDLAEDAFRRALARKTYPAALNNLAWILQRRGALEEALAMSRKAVAVDPRNAATWDTLGVVQMRRGEFADALSSLRRALELNPGMVEATLHLAECLLRAGRGDEARETLEPMARKRAQLTPDQREALSALERNELSAIPQR